MLKVTKDLPKTVERYVKEHKEKGMDDGKAYAIAWSRFCQYSYPNSKRCKKDNYFEGRKSTTATRVSIASRVASAYMKKSYVPNLPTSFQRGLKEDMIRMIRIALSIFATSNPKQLESKLVQNILRHVGKMLPPHASLSPMSAYQFVGHLLRTCDVKLTASAMEEAISSVLGSAPSVQGQVRGILEALVEDMIEGLSEDMQRGHVKSQRKALKVLVRTLGCDDYEAQQILDAIVSEVPIKSEIAPDQVNMMLASFLTQEETAIATQQGT